MNEKRIEKMMKNLDISREEAIQLIADDEAVDKMTKASDINADLTEEQKAVIKEARKADRKPTVYNFNKRTRKADNEKAELVEMLAEALKGFGVLDLEIVNAEKLITFAVGGNNYKLDLIKQRKK